MDTVSLSALKRAPAENVKLLRKAGEVPGVIYGNKVAATSIKCKAKDFNAVYRKAGESTLVEVEIDGQKIPTLIHALSLHPVTGAYEHVDFYAVDMTKKVTTHVPLAFEGESPAVKNLGGVLVTVHDTVTVTCLPKDLPHSFTVSLGSLAEFRNVITVASLTVPAGVTVMDAPEMVLVTVQEPRKEEEIAPPVAAGAEGATAEGAAAPAAAEGATATAPAAEKTAGKAPEEKGKKEKK